MIKIGIVMPILTQFRMALEAISSVKTKYDWQFYPICNWINGFSVARSWNLGIDLAIADRCDYIFILNDDILLSKYAIDRLVDEMERDESIGVLTAWDYRNNVAHAHSIQDFDPVDHSISDGPDFACFLLRPRAYKEIGPFDEDFWPAYFEDNDYHYRCKIVGWKCVALRSAAFYHYGSATQQATTACPPRQFEENRAYYVRKWGGLPGDEKWKEPFSGF